MVNYLVLKCILDSIVGIVGIFIFISWMRVNNAVLRQAFDVPCTTEEEAFKVIMDDNMACLLCHFVADYVLALNLQ